MKMQNTFLLLIISLTLSTLVGCEQSQKAFFYPEYKKKVRTIALIPPQNPDEIYIIDTFGQELASAAFGLIGQAIGRGRARDDMKNRTHAFKQAITDTPFDFKDNFTQNIKQKLTSAGYNVTVVDNTKSNPARFLESYYNLPKADAYLDTTLAIVGFINNPSQLFEPWIEMNTRLITPDALTTYYRDSFRYGQSSAFSVPVNIDRTDSLKYEETERLRPPEKYQFQDFLTLLRQKRTAVDGLNYGIVWITNSIAKKLTVYNSTLYIYRPDEFIKHYVDISVKIDDQPFGTLKNKTHLLTTLPPGPHVITTKGGGKSPELITQLNIQEGQTIYLKIKIQETKDFKDLWLDKLKATVMPVDKGLTEMQKTKGPYKQKQ